MPVFNGERYLARAIQSILGQTYTNFEFLIVSEAGTNEQSLAIIGRCGDARIRHLHNDARLGLPRSLNRAIEEARGTYLARMDSDDIALPHRLKRQVAFLDAHGDVGVCSSGMSLLRGGDGSRRLLPWRLPTGPVEWLLLWENPVAHPTVMLRARLLRDTGLRYLDVPAEDGELWSSLVLHTKIRCLDDVLLHYQLHDDSAFGRTREQTLRQAVQTSRRLAETVAGRRPPELHDDLTVFGAALGRPLTAAPYDDLASWLQELLAAEARRWHWDERELDAAVDDAQRRICAYLFSRGRVPALATLMRAFSFRGKRSLRRWKAKELVRLCGRTVLHRRSRLEYPTDATRR